MQQVQMQQVANSQYGAAYPYPQAQYGFPATFYQGQYPAQAYGGQFNSGFRGGRGGRGGMYPQGFGGRGGYAGYQGPAVGFQGGFGGRGGMMFGQRARRKKPFVGGSLETQRQWEQQTLCCFFLQGQCKFSEGCRFSHSDDGHRACQFGSQCRVGHGSRSGNTEAQAPQEATN